jgi:hypothetical protein
MSAMTVTQALRVQHVRTLNGRACPCCVRLQGADTAKLRRAQRRREAQALRTGRGEL